MKLYIDIVTSAKGGDFSKVQQEVAKLEGQFRSAGHVVENTNLKIKETTQATAAAIQRQADTIEKSTGHIAQAQKKLTSIQSVRPAGDPFAIWGAPTKAPGAQGQALEWIKKNAAEKEKITKDNLAKLAKMQDEAYKEDFMRAKAHTARMSNLMEMAHREDRARTKRANDRALAEQKRQQEKERKEQEKANKKPGAFAGVGLLNYFSKLPGGSTLAPLAAMTGMLKGIGSAAMGLGLVVSAVKGLEAAFGMAVRAGQALLRTSISLTTQGYEYNSMMQGSRLGVAAMITSFTDIVDLQGKLVSGSQKWDAAMTISGAIQKRLRATAIQTAASYEQLVRAMQEASGPAIAKGFQPDEIVTFTTQVAQVAQAIQLPFEQLNQEVRGLLEGDMSRNSRIARLLLSDLAVEAKKSGKTVGDEIQKMAKNGTLFYHLSEQMKDFTKAAEAGANTYANALSNLKDAFSSALGEATAGATARITTKIRELTDSIVTFNSYGEMKFNQDFIAGLRAMGDGVTWLGSKIIDVIKKLDGLAVAARAYKKEFAENMPRTALLSMIPVFGPLLAAQAAVPGANRNMREEEAGRKGLEAFTRRMNQAGGFGMATRGVSATYVDPETYEKSVISAKLPKINRYDMEGGLSGFLQQINEFRNSNGALATVALFREIDAAVASNVKQTGDASVSAEQLGMAMERASFQGYRFNKEIVDGEKKLQDHSGAAAALLNKYEALAEAMRGAADAMSDLNSRAKESLLRTERDITVMGHENNIKTAEGEISLVELRAQERGGLQNPDIDRIKVLKERIVLEQHLIAIAKIGFEQEDRKLELANMQLDAAKKLATVEKYRNDLDQLNAERAKAKGPVDKAAIDKQIKDITDAYDAAQDSYKDLLDNMEKLRNANASKDKAAIEQAEKDLQAAYLAVYVWAQGERQKIENAGNKKALQQQKRLIRELQREWERFGDMLGRAVSDAFSVITKGGSIKDAFSSIADGITEMIGGALQQTVSDWWAELSRLSGATSDGAGNYTDATGAPVDAQAAKNAKIGQGAIMAASGIYSVWNNGGTRGQNMMAGVSTGASVGASIGAAAGPYAIVGAVIGAIVGGIIGAFAPSAQKVGYRFSTGIGGKIIASGKGDAKQYQVDEALRELNKSIGNSRASIIEMFTTLPTSVLVALTKDLTPAMLPFVENIDAVTGSQDKLRDFITNEIPGMVLDSYMPAIEEASKLIGISDNQVAAIIEHAQTLDFEDAKKFITDFWKNYQTVLDVATYAAMSTQDRITFARGRANQTPIDRMRDLQDRTMALAPSSAEFAKMDVAEQTRWMNILGPMIEDRYQMELDYIAQIDATFKEIYKNIDDQIFGYQLEDMDPQQQVDALLARGRDIKDQIALAKTPEEVARLAQEYQQIIDQIVKIGGNRPEDRANAIADLEDLRERVKKREDELIEEVKALGKPYFDMIGQILAALRDGVLAATGGNPPETRPQSPTAPDRPGPVDLTPWNEAVIGTTASMTAFGEAIDATAETWSRTFDPTLDADPSTTSTGTRSWEPTSNGATASITVNPPQVNVVIQGSIERVLQQMQVTVAAEAMKQVMDTLDRRERRRRATG